MKITITLCTILLSIQTFAQVDPLNTYRFNRNNYQLSNGKVDRSP